MSAWNGSEAFSEAMQVPCGCELLHKAEDALDKSERELLEMEGPEFQEQWNCIWSKSYKKQKEPSKKCKESFVPLSRLMKVPVEVLQEEVKTCPRACTSQPWVSEGVEFYNWREKGQLQLLFADGTMPNVVKEAIDAVSQGVRNYEAYQARVAKQRMEQSAADPGKMIVK